MEWKIHFVTKPKIYAFLNIKRERGEKSKNVYSKRKFLNPNLIIFSEK